MDNLTFETLNQGWNSIRQSGAPNLRSAVSGLIDPARIIMQRIGETAQTLTVMFKGFDQALDNPDTEAPLVKKAILDWIREMAEAQIQRTGDQQTFIVRIVKSQTPAPAAQFAENKRWQEIAEALMAGPPRKKIHTSLVHISHMRTSDGR